MGGGDSSWMTRIIVLALVALSGSCTTQAPADCSTQEARIAELERALTDEIQRAAAARSAAQPAPTATARPRYQRNPWSERLVESKEGGLQVLLSNALTLDEDSPVLAILCENGIFTITLGADREFPAGPLAMVIAFDGGPSTKVDAKLPKATRVLGLPRGTMDDILARETMTITAGDAKYGPFVLSGLETHLETSGHMCGL
jgi:hypothetical protein